VRLDVTMSPAVLVKPGEGLDHPDGPEADVFLEKDGIWGGGEEIPKSERGDIVDEEMKGGGRLEGAEELGDVGGRVDEGLGVDLTFYDWRYML
jgi:hypothetical protein